MKFLVLIAMLYSGAGVESPFPQELFPNAVFHGQQMGFLGVPTSCGLYLDEFALGGRHCSYTACVNDGQLELTGMSCSSVASSPR